MNTTSISAGVTLFGVAMSNRVMPAFYRRARVRFPTQLHCRLCHVGTSSIAGVWISAFSAFLSSSLPILMPKGEALFCLSTLHSRKLVSYFPLKQNLVCQFTIFLRASLFILFSVPCAEFISHSKVFLPVCSRAGEFLLYDAEVGDVLASGQTAFVFVNTRTQSLHKLPENAR